jgi:molecular chaperone GrpE
MKRKGKDRVEEEKAAEAEGKQVQQLQEQVKALAAEKEDIFGKLQRVSADYANFQKRVSKQIADTIAYEKETIIKTLLPALDNFEHTLQNADSAENAEAILKGVRIIYDQILGILKSHGVEQINARGNKFDPSLHEAMMQKAEPEKQPDSVLEEFQKGYRLNGRVIRPSKVVVNKIPLPEPAGEQVTEEGDVEEPETTDIG